MKKVALVAAALALALAIAGCAAPAASSPSAASSSSASSSVSSSASASSSFSASASSSSSAAKDVQVPDLKGRTKEDALKALSDVGLKGVESNPEESTEVQPGQVLKQSIAAGTTVKEGESVAYTLAVAPSQVDVPDVVGKTHDEAKKAIEDAGLAFDYTSAHDTNVAEGKVISQSAAAGTKLQKGATVSVVVSLGAEPTPNVDVPFLVGLTWSEAEATLKGVGLGASYTGDKDGTVVSQDIAEGTSVAAGTTVAVTLEKQKEQNPAMNFVGGYQADRAAAHVEAVGDTDAKVTIFWANSATEGYSWEFTGKLDPNTLKMTYKKGVKTKNSDDGKEQTVYKDGTGTITFNAGNMSFTWKDDKENAGKGLTFEYMS